MSDTAIGTLLGASASRSPSYRATLDLVARGHGSTVELLKFFENHVSLLQRQLRDFVERPSMRGAADARIVLECLLLSLGRIAPVLFSVLQDLYSENVTTGAQADWGRLAGEIAPLTDELLVLESEWRELASLPLGNRSLEVESLLKLGVTLTRFQTVFVGVLSRLLQAEVDAGAVK